MNKDKLETAIQKMISTDRMHKRLFDNSLSDIGIHRSAHMILLSIKKNGGIPSQKRLAEIVGITPAAVTGALKTLEKSGYITRNFGQDSRYNEVNITDAGLALLSSARSMFSQIDKALFQGFDEEELDTYIYCLDKMQKNMQTQLDKYQEANQ